MKKTFGDYLVILLSIIGSFASILGFVDIYYKSLNGEGKWAVIFLGVIALFFLWYNIYLISKYRKKSRYVYAFEEFNNGYSYMHSIERLEEISKQEVYNRFHYVCTSISNAFSRINGHHCGVCLKILAVKNSRPKLLTYCRDEKSTKRRLIGPKDNIDHWMSENSDFNFINEGIKSSQIEYCHFFANYLPWKYDYANTRLKNWPPKKILFLNLINRQLFWPLQYRSTIVVPILPLSANEQDKDALRGFLCIDSPRNVAFYKQFDVEILKGLADGLYNKIDKLYDLIKDEK